MSELVFIMSPPFLGVMQTVPARRLLVGNANIRAETMHLLDHHHGSAFCRLADSTGQRIRLVGLEGPWCESSSDKGGAIPVCRPKKHIRLHLLRLEKQKTKTFMAVTTEPDTSSSSCPLNIRIGCDGRPTRARWLGDALCAS